MTAMLEERGRRKGKRNSEGGSPLWGGGCLAPTLPFRPSGFLSRSTQVTLLCKLPNLRESLLFQVTPNPFLMRETEHNWQCSAGTVVCVLSRTGHCLLDTAY